MDSNKLAFEKLLEASRTGDERAWSSIVSIVYGDLRRLAKSHRRSSANADRTLDTTALVHECYLKLCGNAKQSIQSRAHFFNLASRVMRQVLCDYARERLATKRGGDQSREDLDVAEREDLQEASMLLELDDLLRKLAIASPVGARVFECRYFAGLSEQETAQALNIGLRTVQRYWRDSRDWLESRMTA